MPFLFFFFSFNFDIILPATGYAIHYNPTSFILSPDYKITETGQMHIRNLRKVGGKEEQCEDAKMKELYFSKELQAVCKRALEDCLIELEDSELDDFAERQKSIKERYDMICSTSASESITEICPIGIPKLVQDVKEIFHYKSDTHVFNGLRGLFKEEVKALRSRIKEAQEGKKLGRVVSMVGNVLANLCQKNTGDHTTAFQIQLWRRTLMIPLMLDFLEQFFERCPQDRRLLKRLRYLSEKQNEIMDGSLNGDEVELTDAFNTAMRLIDFAKFEESKLVRFELKSSSGSYVACNSGIIGHDSYNDVFSQEFTITEGRSGKVQLHPTAWTVRFDGQALQEKPVRCGSVSTFRGTRLKLSYEWLCNNLTCSIVRPAGNFPTLLSAHTGMIELYSCRVECLYIQSTPDNSNLALTRTKIDFPWISVINSL